MSDITCPHCGEDNPKIAQKLRDLGNILTTQHQKINRMIEREKEYDSFGYHLWRIKEKLLEAIR